MRPGQVFISYRRDDAAGHARAVHGELAAQFGADRVFIDVDDIAAGASFAEVIDSAVGQSGVLLVLIGRRWAGPRDGLPARLHDADDFVRLEVAAGLRARRPVLPVLLDGAPMPAAADLPAPLKPLAGLQALPLDATRHADDMARLVDAVARALGEAPPAQARRRRVLAALAAGLGVAAAGALGLAGWAGRKQGTATAPAAAARPPVNGTWQAELTYPWNDRPRTERFEFSGAGTVLQGSAGFLGVPRGIVDGQVGPDGVVFETRTADLDGRELRHRYRATLSGDTLAVQMSTEGAGSDGTPLRFTARRVGSGG